MQRVVVVLTGLLLGFIIAGGCSPSTQPVASIQSVDFPATEVPLSSSVAATPIPSPTATPAPTALPTVDLNVLAQGETIYKTMYCGTCHQLDALSTQGIFGPDHSNMAVVAAERVQAEDYTGKATTAAEYIRESIVEPEAYLVADYVTSRHKMPKYSFLPSADIDALVYLLSQQTTP